MRLQKKTDTSFLGAFAQRWACARRIMLATTFVCVSASTSQADNAAVLGAAELLDMAWSESERNGHGIESAALIELASLLGRFDKARSRALFHEVLSRVPAKAPTAADLRTVELVAMHASHVDVDTSTAALELVRSAGKGVQLTAVKPDDEDERATLHWDDRACQLTRMRLKQTAIEMVLKHRRGARNTAATCRRLTQVGQGVVFDQGCGMRLEGEDAIATYVRRLDYGLAEAMSASFAQPLAWSRRIALLDDLVHYRPQALPVWVRAMFDAAPDWKQVALACALYEAGAENDALALLRQTRPKHTGGGSPFGDLVERVAGRDPERALVLARLIEDEDARQWAYCTVVRGAYRTHPEEAVLIAAQIENRHRKASMLAGAVDVLLKQGKAAMARDVAQTIVRAGPSGCYAVGQAHIADTMKDAVMMKSALNASLHEDLYGRGLRNCVRISVRSIGVKATQAALVELVPELETSWVDERLFCVLDEMGRVDPGWVLPIFQRGPAIRLQRNSSVHAVAALSLLPALAAVDPAYVAQYVNRHCDEVYQVASIKADCTAMAGRRSEAEALAFARGTGLEADTSVLNRINLQGLAAQLTASPREGDSILMAADVKPFGGPSRPLLTAVEHMMSRMPYGLADTNAVISLAYGLEDEAMGDVCLSEAVIHSRHHGRLNQGLALLPLIRSPSLRVATLCQMARSGLAYRPSERVPYLFGGWELLNEAPEIEPMEDGK